jgi:hypothetical protein
MIIALESIKLNTTYYSYSISLRSLTQAKFTWLKQVKKVLTSHLRKNRLRKFLAFSSKSRHRKKANQLLRGRSKYFLRYHALIWLESSSDHPRKPFKGFREPSNAAFSHSLLPRLPCLRFSAHSR